MVITVSNAMKEELIGLGFPADKIRVVYNGVDPQKYCLDQVSTKKMEEVRQQYGLEESDSMILFLGRLVWVKGADKLIAAMPQVLKEVPNAKLIIIGVGDMQECLEHQVQNLKLQDAVKFRFEFISEEERIANYAACDLAVFPSIYEPFGIVAVEAMSMEKPVVVGASGISGMREIVIPYGQEQCGFHFNPNDPTDIAWGIINSLKDPQRKFQLGQNGRKRVLQEFTWDTIAKRTLQLYNELLEYKKT
jgi:glycogen(starch) synthase